MSRRQFVRGAAAVTGAAAASEPSEAKPPSPPNLIFVFPDEFRRQAIGCMGEDPVITPHLDRFAAQSTVLTNAISNRPVCSPYRASMLTGRYPFSTGVTTNCYDGSVPCHVYLRESERCISDVLHDLGCSCGYIGKWHLEAPRKPYLFDRGPGGVWDEYTPPGPRHRFDFWHSYGCHDDHMHPHYWIGNAPRDAWHVIDEWSPRHDASVAVDYIRNRDGKYRAPGAPFALFVSMNPPHMPFQMVPQEYVERYGARTPADLLTRPNVDLSTEVAQFARKWAKHYFAAVTGIDEQFGRILQCLEDEGLDDDTIVVFTSDHGEMMGSHGQMYKVVWYEESLGVPFLIRWPRRILPGREEMLLGAPDVMPTLLGLMGLGRYAPHQVEGEDYSGVLLRKSGRRARSALYLNYDPTSPSTGARGVRTNRHTYAIVSTAAGEARHLYANTRDPYQMRNLAGAEPALDRHLRAELDRWLLRTRDPWATPA